MSKWIEFTHERLSDSGKTKIWTVQAKEKGDVLGEVRWWASWRQYTFFAAPNCIFEKQCLRDIADFCERKTIEQFRASRAVKAKSRQPMPTLQQSFA